MNKERYIKEIKQWIQNGNSVQDQNAQQKLQGHLLDYAYDLNKAELISFIQISFNYQVPKTVTSENISLIQSLQPSLTNFGIIGENCLYIWVQALKPHLSSSLHSVLSSPQKKSKSTRKQTAKATTQNKKKQKDLRAKKEEVQKITEEAYRIWQEAQNYGVDLPPYPKETEDIKKWSLASQTKLEEEYHLSRPASERRKRKEELKNRLTESQNTIIGIDFGSVHTRTSICKNGASIHIPNQSGQIKTPSVVAYKNKKWIVGEEARIYAQNHPNNAISSIKRFLGKSFMECQALINEISNHVRCCPNGFPEIQLGGQYFPPDYIASKLLQSIKEDAEGYLGQEIHNCVIASSGPVTHFERIAFMDAAAYAGMSVSRIVSSSSAYTLHHGMNKADETFVVVYDWGKELEIGVLEVEDNIIEVRSKAGNAYLGDALDQMIINHFISTFKKEHGIDVSGDKMIVQRLREQAEKSKKELSTTMNTEINLPFLTTDASGPKHLMLNLSRSQFEQIINSIIDQAIEPCRQALNDAGVRPSEIDEVILVGGSTHIPLVQKKLKELFGRTPHHCMDQDGVVAMGAAIQGGIISGNIGDVLLLDVSPLSLGIETVGGIAHEVIPRNTTIPAKKSEVFSTTKDNQQEVDIYVYQGEHEMVENNWFLGRVTLKGIAPAPRGLPKIAVTFDLDANHNLQVTAIDEKTGMEVHVQIEQDQFLAPIRKQTENEIVVSFRGELHKACYELEELLEENNLSTKAQETIKKRISTARSTDLEDDIAEQIEKIKSTIQTVKKAIAKNKNE